MTFDRLFCRWVLALLAPCDIKYLISGLFWQFLEICVTLFLWNKKYFLCNTFLGVPKGWGLWVWIHQLGIVSLLPTTAICKRGKVIYIHKTICEVCNKIPKKIGKYKYSLPYYVFTLCVFIEWLKALYYKCLIMLNEWMKKGIIGSS